MIPDRQLLTAFTNKEPRACNAIYDIYNRVLVVYINRFIDDKLQAQEIANDVFMKIYNKGYQYETNDHLRAYLQVIAKRSALDYIKSRKPLDKKSAAYQYLERQEQKAAQSSAGDLHIEEYIQIAMQEIEKLPPRQKKVIQLKFLEDKDTNEIAEMLGIEKSTVYTNKTVGLNKLKQILKRILFKDD